MGKTIFEIISKSLNLNSFNKVILKIYNEILDIIYPPEEKCIICRVDGYFFLQEWWNCSETNQLNWTYYPPSPFKILLYFPETDFFYVSPIYERYAFDSYYTVDLSDYTEDGISAEESYDYTWEGISLGARILLTILLELLIALPFGYREKKVLGFLAIVNIITQILLNVALVEMVREVDIE